MSVSLFLVGIYHSFHFSYITLFGIREVGMSPMMLGIFLSASTIGSITASTIIGRISDKARSRKRLLMGVIVSCMEGYAMYAFSREYAVLLLASLFLVSFSWATFPQLFAFAGEIDVRGREEDRAFVQGFCGRSSPSAGWWGRQSARSCWKSPVLPCCICRSS